MKNDTLQVIACLGEKLATFKNTYMWFNRNQIILQSTAVSDSKNKCIFSVLLQNSISSRQINYCRLI